MRYIQLKSKEHFKVAMKQYKKDWKPYMWNTFKEDTCYLPEENCFLSLSKAIELGYLESK